MERSQVLTIAIVVAALTLFSLKFFMGSSVIEEEIGGPERYASGSGVDKPGSPGAGGSRESSAGTRGGGMSGHESRLAAVGGARSGPDGGRASVDGERRGAETVSGGAVRGGGSVGASASARRSGAGSGVSVASSGGKTALGGLQGRDREHGNLIEKLSSVPVGQSVVSADPNAAQTPGQDVVLSVAHGDDLQQTNMASGVKPKDDGVGIDFTPDAVVAFPEAGNVNGDAGSIAFDVTPQWNGAEDDNNSFVRLQVDGQWANRLELVRNGRFLRFIVTDSAGVERDISTLVDSWQPNEPHHVTATWGDGQTSLYVDGRRIASAEIPNPLVVAPGTPLYIGSKGGNYRGANSTIENFKVYGRVLGPDEAY